MEDLLFDTPAVDLLGDADETPIYYWMDVCDEQGEYELTPAFF